MNTLRMMVAQDEQENSSPMRWSIRYQLLVPLVLLLGSVVGLSTWVTIRSARKAAEQQIEKQMQTIARNLSEATYPLNHGVLQQVSGLSGAEYVLIARSGHRISTLSDSSAIALTETVAEDWRNLHFESRVQTGGQTYRCGALRIGRGRPEEGSVLYILYPEAAWQEILHKAVYPPLGVGLLGSVTAGGLALWLAQRLSRRIRQLQVRTQEIAQGNFCPMPLSGRNDEILDLGRSVNEMAQRLADLEEIVRKTERLRLAGQVSGGLLHQLRNGVTGARLAIQVHAQDCRETNDGEALEVAVRQLKLTEEKLQRFLQIGKEPTIDRRQCSLTNLIDEAIGLLRPQCRHQHVELRWQQPSQDEIISADSNHLGHLLLNVLGNAIEAAGPTGWVEVRLIRAKTESPRSVNGVNKEPTPGNFAVIEVSDSGPGPDSKVAARLFEPFVTGKQEGIGLGLAVARQIAEAHNGYIDWRHEAKETCFRIHLPLTTEESVALSQG